MDSYIDRELQQPESSPRHRRPRDFFGWMLFISLALHMITSIIVLSPRTSSLSTPPASFIDLQNMQFEKPPLLQPTVQQPEAPPRSSRKPSRRRTNR